jgi:protocatechuate 3,4-dioxygenase beta subunit
VLARIDDSETEYTWDEVLNGTAVLGKPSTRTITGKVLDRLTGSPVANAKLSVGAEGPTALAAEDGTFTIAGIDPSQVRLSARADGYQETIRQAMRSDSGPVEVHLDRGELTVRGRITDDKGAPIAGAVIKIENDGSSATTDADGRAIRSPASRRTAATSATGSSTSIHN